MSDRVRGYRIVLKIATLLIAGDIDASYKIAAEFDEVLTKASTGTKELDFKGVGEEFGVGGLMALKTTGEASTHIDVTDIRPYVRAGTQLAFSYGIHEADLPIVTGNLVITNWDESNDSENNAVASISCKIVGDVTETTYSPPA